MKCKITFWALLITICCQGQSLWVTNPDTWDSVRGTINEAQFTITPRGIYLEVGMYLTLSAKDANYINWVNDSIDLEQPEYDLESSLRFSLPSEAMVIDSWLWVNEDLIQADIEERWKATRTFEEIVGYRLDPSLLTKDTWYGSDESYYALRVYPLQGDSTRRVKITYLTPGKWSRGKVSINLPMDILAASKVPVEDISVQCFLAGKFSNPTVLQFPDRTFSNENHAALGDFSQMPFTSTDIINGLDISFDVEMENGVFLSNYNNGETDFYQMAIIPPAILLEEERTNKKVAFLIDYDSSNTYVPKQVLLDNLKNQMKENLGQGDLFNLIFVGQNGLELINSNWINANDQIIDNVFSLLEEAYTLADESHLSELLEAGLTFVQDGSAGGSLFVLSCSDELSGREVGDAYISDLASIYKDSLTSIIIADYQNKDLDGSYYFEPFINEAGFMDYLNLGYLYGNEYFYLALNKLFFGTTHLIREQKSLISLLNSSFDAINPIQNFGGITVKSGTEACFSQYTLDGTLFSNHNTPILQIGKCKNNLPISVEVAGTVNNQNVRKTITLNKADDVNEGDRSHEIAWVGNYIQALENRDYWFYTQSIAEEAIEWSINHRVLSVFTAFLALEPGLGGYVCEECVDETMPNDMIPVLIDGIRPPQENEVELPNITFGLTRGEEWTIAVTEDSVVTSVTNPNSFVFNQIHANPNPFRAGVQFTMKLNEVAVKEAINCMVFDLSGKRVKQLIPEPTGNTTEFQAFWDGTDDQNQRLPAGMYIMTVRTPKGWGSLKLILME